MDQYDRIWDADKNFMPFHVSTGFNTQLSFNFSSIQESPPVSVLQTARVLARRDVLTYSFPLDTLGDYFIVLYFAGIIPVSPTFNVLINGDIAESNYTVRSSEAGALYFTRKAIKTLNITIKSISFYPLVNALEVFEIVGIPSEVSSTTGAIYFWLSLLDIFLRFARHSLTLLLPLFYTYTCSFSTSSYSTVYWFRCGMGGRSMLSQTMGSRWM